MFSDVSSLVLIHRVKSKGVTTVLVSVKMCKAFV